MAVRQTLVVDNGDLPSLVCLALESERRDLIIWHLSESDAAADRRRAIVEEHAALFSQAPAIIGALADIGLDDVVASSEKMRSFILFSAALVAMELGCPRLVWPAVCSGCHESMGREMERAALVCALLEIGDDHDRLVIDCPLIDLTDEQVLALADDLNLPVAQACGKSRVVPAPAGIQRG